MTFLFQVQLRKDDCMISQVDERTSYLLSQCIFFRNGQRHSTDLLANCYCELSVYSPCLFIMFQILLGNQRQQLGHE